MQPLPTENSMKINYRFTSEAAQLSYGPNGPMPSTEFSAGIDLRAIIDGPLSILPGEQVMIPTGICVDMMEAGIQLGPYRRLCAKIIPRSGLGSKQGLTLGNSQGLIDQDYHGEMMVCAYHRPTSGHVNMANARLGGTPIHIEPGQRIVQITFEIVVRPELVLVAGFGTQTERGEGGHGSTGTH